jgi:hypothetical protein
MNGLFMMLKSFGLNPDELIGQAENIRQVAQNVAETMARIEAKQDRILALLEPTPNAQLTQGDENEQTNGSSTRTSNAA